MAAENLLTTLRKLEVVLHQPNVRGDASRLNSLLHEEFAEFGRSGKVYSKAEVLRNLPRESPSPMVWSQDFIMVRLSDSVALLTYKSAQIAANGELSRHTLRSSIWQRMQNGWQMRFHQGTPTDAFARAAT